MRPVPETRRVAAIYHGFRARQKGSHAMMAAYKRIQIIVETDRVLIIRRRGCVRHWCSECGRETDMVSLSQAGLRTGVAELLLRDGARGGKWHMTETAGGSPLICLDSLLAARGDARIDSMDPSKEKEQ